MNITAETAELVQAALTAAGVVFVAMALSAGVARLIERTFWK